MARQSTPPRSSPPAWTPVPGGHKRFVGARPTPKHKIVQAPQHFVTEAPPAQFAVVPSRLDMWGNDQYGDCVSAEEAFAKACHAPEIFIDASTVIAWAQRNGYLNGADLTEVMDSMKSSGFKVRSQLYDDGPYTSVDFANEMTLQSALVTGTVKLGMASSALPSGAGNHQGWVAVGNHGGGAQDHCTALTGYGPAGWLFGQLGVPLPSGLSATTPGYLFFTWSTIGFVDHAWIMGCVGEAWVRNPTTIGVPPLPDPTPPTPPTPPVPPLPPTPPTAATVTLSQPLAAGTYMIAPMGSIVVNPEMTLAQVVSAIDANTGAVKIAGTMTLDQIIAAMAGKRSVPVERPWPPLLAPSPPPLTPPGGTRMKNIVGYIATALLAGAGTMAATNNNSPPKSASPTAQPAATSPAPAATPYSAAIERSVKDNTVLVIGVKCDPPNGSDWTALRVESFAWGDEARLVVSKGGNWIKDLPATASQKDIADALRPALQAPVVVPRGGTVLQAPCRGRG